MFVGEHTSMNTVTRCQGQTRSVRVKLYKSGMYFHCDFVLSANEVATLDPSPISHVVPWIESQREVT